MKITEEISLVREYKVPAGTPHYPSISVSQKDIRGLIVILSGIGVEIDANKSKQQIRWGNKQESFVPLSLHISHDSPEIQTMGYSLRANQLEIDLRDCFLQHPSIPGAIGCEVYCEEGILGTIVFEGTYQQGAAVPKVKQAVEKFYRPLFESRMNFPKIRVTNAK